MDVVDAIMDEMVLVELGRHVQNLYFDFTKTCQHTKFFHFDDCYVCCGCQQVFYGLCSDKMTFWARSEALDPQ